MALIALAVMSSTWWRKLSFLSNQIPTHLTVSTFRPFAPGDTTVPFRRVTRSLSMMVLSRAVWKCMSSVLESSKATALAFAHWKLLPLAGVHCWLWRY